MSDALKIGVKLRQIEIVRVPGTLRLCSAVPLEDSQLQFGSALSSESIVGLIPTVYRKPTISSHIINATQALVARVTNSAR